jgi:hypothetical protein
MLVDCCECLSRMWLCQHGGLWQAGRGSHCWVKRLSLHNTLVVQRSDLGTLVKVAQNNSEGCLWQHITCRWSRHGSSMTGPCYPYMGRWLVDSDTSSGGECVCMHVALLLCMSPASCACRAPLPRNICPLHPCYVDHAKKDAMLLGSKRAHLRQQSSWCFTVTWSTFPRLP